MRCVTPPRCGITGAYKVPFRTGSACGSPEDARAGRYRRWCPAIDPVQRAADKKTRIIITSGAIPGLLVYRWRVPTTWSQYERLEKKGPEGEYPEKGHTRRYYRQLFRLVFVGLSDIRHRPEQSTRGQPVGPCRTYAAAVSCPVTESATGSAVTNRGHGTITAPG
ncbi:Uncharacterized protein FWK35_00035017 [Aphis craccivora]|uniref:Uncharacterized protein n=1 Tax=Aphis craccivora TaxID=307492 RepID=A0A6G0YPP9_APHCR|nr:Uncharacterized protein FWK35_00035017 [Aphis craccivora]